MTKNYFTKCTDGNKVENTEVQLIEQAQEGNYDLEGKLWCSEKFKKPNFLHLTERIVHGTGMIPIKKAIENNI